MSERAMYAWESTTPHWHLGGRTWKLCCTHNSNLVRSGEGGADPPGARWCTEHKGLILECSLDLERAWCFPLMTGCSVVRGVGSPLLERHGGRPLKHQGQKETVQLLAPGTPSHAPLHQRTLQILAAGPGLTFQIKVIILNANPFSKWWTVECSPLQIHVTLIVELLNCTAYSGQLAKNSSYMLKSANTS